MRLILLMVFITGYLASFGQNTNVTPKTVLEVINVSITQRQRLPTKPCKNGLCGGWYTRNKDSAFYKNDTLLLYNSSTIMRNSGNVVKGNIYSCTFEVFEFLEHNKMSQQSFNICKDNRMTDAESDAKNRGMMGEDQWKKIEEFRESLVPHEYKIGEEGSKTILTFFTGDKLFYSFKVHNIKKYKKRKFGKHSYVMTLIRQHVQ